MAVPYLNKVLISGRLVRSPELRLTSAGVPVSNFKIASCKKYFDDQDQTREEICYIGVATWDELAKHCKAKLNKGTEVHIEGELKSRLRRNDNGIKRSFVEIRADVVKYLNRDGELSDVTEGAPITAMPVLETLVEEPDEPEYGTDEPESLRLEEQLNENDSPFSLVSDEQEEL
ncbi:MAG: single-stranded DNA-binding protein [Candidatus Zixiibacteriota bacterium]